MYQQQVQPPQEDEGSISLMIDRGYMLDVAQW